MFKFKILCAINYFIVIYVINILALQTSQYTLCVHICNALTSYIKYVHENLYNMHLRTYHKKHI